LTSENVDARSEIWDPFGTLRRALWIGGGQWAGKFSRYLPEERP